MLGRTVSSSSTDALFDAAEATIGKNKPLQEGPKTHTGERMGVTDRDGVGGCLTEAQRESIMTEQQRTERSPSSHSIATPPKYSDLNTGSQTIAQ